MKTNFKYLWLTPIVAFTTLANAGEVKVFAPGGYTATVSLNPGGTASVTLPKAYRYTFTAAKINIGATNAYYKWADNKFYTTQPPAVGTYRYNTTTAKFESRNGNSNNYNELNKQPTAAPTITTNVNINVGGQTWVATSNLLKGNGDRIVTDPINYDQPDLKLAGDPAISVVISMTGTAPAVDGTIELEGVMTKDAPIPGGRLMVANNVSAAMAGEYPSISWVIARDGSLGGTTPPVTPPGGGTTETPSETTSSGGTFTDGTPGNGNLNEGHPNNGHGNNLDGVDCSNPGKGKGGPTGLKNAGLDPSGTVDDEIIKNLNAK